MATAIPSDGYCRKKLLWLCINQSAISPFIMITLNLLFGRYLFDYIDLRIPMMAMIM